MFRFALTLAAAAALLACDKKETPKPAPAEPAAAKADPAAAKADPAAAKADPAPAAKADPASAAAPQPPVAAVIIHKVADFDAWKKAFDAHGAARKAASVVGHHINRGADDDTLLGVYLPATDVTKLKAMMASPELKAAMTEAGVEGPPMISFMKPISSSNLVMDKQMAGLIVTHKVADFAAWKTAYDAFDAARVKAGITGHAVNQDASDPNTVTIYHQAESVDKLKAFMADPGLADAMKKAGVVGPPQVSYWNGGYGAQY